MLREFVPFLKKWGYTPKTSGDPNENYCIRFSIPENPNVEVSNSAVQKCGILHFLPQERLQIRV